MNILIILNFRSGVQTSHQQLILVFPPPQFPQAAHP